MRWLPLLLMVCKAMMGSIGHIIRAREDYFFFNAIRFQGTGVVTVHEVLIFCSFMCVCESSHRLKAHDKFC